MKILSNYTYYAIVKFNYNNFDGIQYMSHNKHFVFCEFKEKFKEKHKKEIEEINNQFEELIKDDEIKEISQNSDFFHHFLHIFPEKTQLKNDLLDYITTLQKENDQLKKRNKEIYDGFISATQELTEYAEENEKLKSIIKKAIKEIEHQGILVRSEWEMQKIYKILKGDDNNE